MTSAWVASCLSQLSIVTECLRQLTSFQPWATKVKKAVKEQKTQLLITYASDLAHWNPLLQTSFKNTGLVALGKPDLKFRYPVNKRRTRINVETLRAAENSLDAFWKAADNQFRLQTRITPYEIVAGRIDERTLQRTAPWIGTEKTSPNATLSQATQYLHTPFSNALHDPAK